MERWLDELAEALGVEPLRGDQSGALLRFTRDVAHGVERRFAPLAAFVVGRAVGRAETQGRAPHEAFAEALERAAALVPPADGEDEATDAPGDGS
jgi:Domain of unknown function (DUF6457)